MRIYAVIASLAILFVSGGQIAEAASTTDVTETALAVIAYGGMGAYASAFCLWLAFGVFSKIG